MTEEKPTTVTSNTLVPAGILATAVGTAVAGTWFVAALLYGINTKIDRALHDRWTQTDMRVWANQLDRANRDRPNAIVVPEVLPVRPPANQ
ncbi:MAG: hypothetical protein B9S38_02465 [Verrucomicrobiia bacterium Tous-C4TDCM]|nr:MAG: hypothetical protein B9S38_02465 [Verrucomicrobiae bacterium Tous-C4TDCM]